MTLSRRPASLIAEELEDRILYSADLNPLGVETTYIPSTTNVTPTYAQTSTAPSAGSSILQQPEIQQRHEVVFIDSGVTGYQDLAKKISSDSSPTRMVEVIIINTDKDGITQITDALQNYKNLDAVHIISHGDPGEMQIGNTCLNNDSLLTSAVAISKWGAALAESGDLLLYGCDLAANQAGINFVNQLGQLTGADINASTDLTGAKNLGGNWSLEYATGHIDSSIALTEYEQAQFSGVLATYTVTNTNDSGAGSFRQAIADANSNSGTDTIAFNIGSGLVTISPTSALPNITGTIIIDGTTQPGFASAPIVQLSGGSAGNTEGLHLTSGASGSTIKGLIINGFNNSGIQLDGASNVTIQGNYIGTNAAGTAASANGADGIRLTNSANNNTIGGTTAALRNIISGNVNQGIRVDSGSIGNVIQGNYIGVDATGTADIGNAWNGISVTTSGNTIGGSASGAGNVISGNNNSGLVFDGSTNNIVYGNYIGTNATGTAAIANSQTGIRIVNSSNNNTIAGSSTRQGNVVA